MADNLGFCEMMHRSMKAGTTLFAALAAASSPLNAQDCTRDAMLVFDGSASMAAFSERSDGAKHIDDARQALQKTLPAIAPIRRIGLITYGPGPENSCDSISVKFAPVADSAQPIMDAIARLDPNGLTPLTEAVREAADVLNFRTDAGIVVLVTDGNDTCGGSPCALGAELARESNNLTVHVIGFRANTQRLGLSSADIHLFPDGVSAAKCISDQTGGTYVSTETVDELSNALQRTLGCNLIG